MVEIVVMSKYQEILDSFFESIMPTIGNTISVCVLSKGLEVPVHKNVRSMYMGQFLPNKYFNKVCDTMSDFITHIGFVNDDILFSPDWGIDFMEMVSRYDFFSPGFVETKNKDKFIKAIDASKNEVGVIGGVLDAFYTVSVSALYSIGGFNENVVEWYDIDLLLKMLRLGYHPVVSKKVKVMHLNSATLKDKLSYKAKVRLEVIDTYGQVGLNKYKTITANTRKEFSKYA